MKFALLSGRTPVLLAPPPYPATELQVASGCRAVRTGRLVLSLGYFATPFAGPGASVITAAGWLVAGSEERNEAWQLIGLLGLGGVAAILAAYYGHGPPAAAGVGGIVLLAYEALSIIALWYAGSKLNTLALKLAAAVLAAAFFIAAATSVNWGAAGWAGHAAAQILAAVGGPAVVGRALAAVGGVLAGIGFLMAPEVASEEGLGEELLALTGLSL